MCSTSSNFFSKTNFLLYGNLKQKSMKEKYRKSIGEVFSSFLLVCFIYSFFFLFCYAINYIVKCLYFLFGKIFMAFIFPGSIYFKEILFKFVYSILLVLRQKINGWSTLIYKGARTGHKRKKYLFRQTK